MCGFSPTARRRRPKRVRYSSHQTAGTSASAQYTSTLWPSRPSPTIGPQAARAARRRHSACRRTVVGHRRRLPALLEPGDAQHHRQARRDDVERHARHHLVAAVADAGEAVQPRQRDRRRMPASTASSVEPNAAPAARGGEGGEQHLAFEARGRPRPSAPPATPASAHRISGVATRSVEASSVPTRTSSMRRARCAPRRAARMRARAAGRRRST